MLGIWLLVATAIALSGCGDSAEGPIVVIETETKVDPPTTDTSDNNQVDDDSDPVEEPTNPGRTAPEYDGTCPVFTEGVNAITSSGTERSFRVELPENPQGAPVIFAWHWLNGNASTLVTVLGLATLADTENVIIIAPESDGTTQFEWRFTQGPQDNPDLQLFKDLLACASQGFEVDLDRIYSTGHSAGGLWTTYLTMHASEWLAATAIMSGGADARSYVTPQNKLPVLIIWGGPNDSYGGFSFASTSQSFGAALKEDGHFVAMCEHTQGHVPPTGATSFIWQWFQDHPRGAEEPYVDGLPSVFPNYCLIP